MYIPIELIYLLFFLIGFLFLLIFILAYMVSRILYDMAGILDLISEHTRFFGDIDQALSNRVKIDPNKED